MLPEGTADAVGRFTPASRPAVRVLPGEHRTIDPGGGSLTTVLGSCIAACIRNPRSGFGGLNHFMLPESRSGDWSGAPASGRFGNFAMEALIGEVLASGCELAELEVKVFGGADLYPSATSVGRLNIEFVTDFLASRGLRPVRQDVGGVLPRKIVYTPATGRTFRLFIRSP